MDIKNTWTNILAWVTAILGAADAVRLVIAQWLSGLSTAKPTFSDWIQLVILIATTVIARFTGRNADGSSKTAAQLQNQINSK